MNLEFHSLNKSFEQSFRANWDRQAVSNYQGETFTYAELCRQIEIQHIIFEKLGVQKGDRIALCGKNQASWAVAFLSSTTYGAVPVPLLHEFNPENVCQLLSHSESKVFFVDQNIWDAMGDFKDECLQAVVRFQDLEIISSQKEGLREEALKEFETRYPNGLRPEDICYYEDQPEEMALLNYTSGTSGFSKGVMIPYRALAANVFFAKQAEPQMDNTSEVVSMLPCAHMYGLMFEFIFEMCIGAHVYFLNKVPSPKVILGAFQDIKPSIIIAVPLIIEKVYRSQLKPVADKLKVLLAIPGINSILHNVMRKKVVTAFGGRFEEVILGGAALNPEVEEFFHKIHFPFTVGYGMTECAPIISYAHWNKAKLGSCGMDVPGTTFRVVSDDPAKVPGEVQVKGDNVFLGYYRNPEATAECFTEDGWFRTGDMGVVKNGYLFLKGRSKCMILSANGQNIYPEELEAVINNFAGISDSLVVDDDHGLTAIIYPDYAGLQKELNLDMQGAKDHIQSLMPAINKQLPGYAQIRKMEFLEEDFERTPKKSIRRYKYQKKA